MWLVQNQVYFAFWKVGDTDSERGTDVSRSLQAVSSLGLDQDHSYFLTVPTYSIHHQSLGTSHHPDTPPLPPLQLSLSLDYFLSCSSQSPWLAPKGHILTAKGKAGVPWSWRYGCSPRPPPTLPAWLDILHMQIWLSCSIS